MGRKGDEKEKEVIGGMECVKEELKKWEEL